MFESQSESENTIICIYIYIYIYTPSVQSEMRGQAWIVLKGD